MKKLFIAAALAALTGTPVLAADMAVKAPAPQTYSWEGLYIGGNVGWLGIEGVSLSGTPADSATLAFLAPCSAAGACPTSIGSAKASSVTGGGQFGFNWQIRNWVVGVEADVQASRADAFSTVNTHVPVFGPYFATQTIKETEFGTVRGRAGMLVTPNLLAYVTGGFAWAQTQEGMTFGFPSLSETAWFARGSTAIGGTVGAGVEWAFWDKWSVAGEYLYARLGATSLAFTTAPLGAGCTPGGTPSCQLNVSESGFTNNVVRLKLNYKIF
ncbi:MAG: porin family protein [Xanthobacteraceae bacterium]|nr:porin family protein [Xanthobacteraceae bacterium]